MNQRDREIVKLALLYLQSQLVDFCDQLEQDEPEGEHPSPCELIVHEGDGDQRIVGRITSVSVVDCMIAPSPTSCRRHPEWHRGGVLESVLRAQPEGR